MFSTSTILNENYEERSNEGNEAFLEPAKLKSISGLEEISFGALAAAQASLTSNNDGNTKVKTDPSLTSQPFNSLKRKHRDVTEPSTIIPQIKDSKYPKSAKYGQITKTSNRASTKHQRKPQVPPQFSKHAPTVISSTKPVTRRRVVVSGSVPVSSSETNIAAYRLATSTSSLDPLLFPSTVSRDQNINTNSSRRARDPRFHHFSGSAPSASTLTRRYGFLDEYRAAEADALRNIVDPKKGADEKKKRKKNKTTKKSQLRSIADATAMREAEVKAQARRTLQQHEALTRNMQRARQEEEFVQRHRRSERAALKEGRKEKVWFLKRGDIKKGVEMERSGANGETGRDGLGAIEEGTKRTKSMQKREVRSEKKLMHREKESMASMLKRRESKLKEVKDGR